MDETLDGIFDSPTAKIIDLYTRFNGEPFTTSIASKAVELSFKTTSKAITRLEKNKVLLPATRMRNAKAYRFNQKSPIIYLLRSWLIEEQLKTLKD